MFRITKIKVAAAIAAGAVALGAAGAYAANNGMITLSKPPTALTIANGPTGLVSLSGASVTLENFKNVGDCVSFFAQNRDLALATSVSAGNTKLAKNFHGKLVSEMAEWCRDHVTKTDTDGAGK